MSIEIKKFSHTYMPGTPFEKKALKDIDLKIEENTFLALIGHTGSGKSTLAQSLAGLLNIEKGKVYLNDLDMSSRKIPFKKVGKKVGIVFQYPEHQLFAETVAEDIGFGMKNMGMEKAEITEHVKKTMQELGLSEDLRQRSPFMLSGGQKRKVALAGILALKPELLILDEPTAGLDPKSKKEMNLLVRKYHQQKKGIVLWISHDMSEVAKFADRIIVLNKGEVMMDGTPYEVFDRGEELIKISLDIPEMAKIVRKLRKKGKDLPGKAIQIEEAYQEIKEWLEE